MELQDAFHSGISSRTVRTVDLSSLLSLHPAAAAAVEAAGIAGGVIREAAAGASRRRGLKEKAVADLVTEVDLACDRAVRTILELRSPQVGILSEESGSTGPRSAAQWIVDPLDGTSAFVFGTSPSEPAVLLAFQERGRTVLSVIHCPLTGEWFAAVRDKGAYHLDSHGGLQRLAVPGQSVPLRNAWVALNEYGDTRFSTAPFARLRACLRSAEGAQLVTSPAPHSSIGCRVIAGTGPHAVVHDNNPAKVKQEIWDYAPIRLFVEESGGVMVGLDGLPYTEQSKGPLFIAGSAVLVGELIARAHGDPARTVVVSSGRCCSGELADFLLDHGKNEWNFLPEAEVRSHMKGVETGSVCALLAFREGQPAGIVTYETGRFYDEYHRGENPDRPVGYVAEAVVRRDLQGQGIGSMLLKRATAALLRDGVKLVYAKRHEENAASAGMMRKAGFRMIDTFVDPIRPTGSGRTTVERFEKNSDA